MTSQHTVSVMHALRLPVCDALAAIPGAAEVLSSYVPVWIFLLHGGCGLLLQQPQAGALLRVLVRLNGQEVQAPAPVHHHYCQ